MASIFSPLILIYILIIFDLVPNISARSNKNKRRTSKNNQDNNFFGDFKRYSAIKSFLNQISEQNPKLTQLSTIGKTTEARNLILLKIGEQLDQGNKQIIYIDGGLHAREWVAITTPLYIIESLLNDYKKNDPDVKMLMQKYDFYIAPLLNPDGYEYTHTKDRLWRKNRAKLPGTNCVGVDLNRNYPFHWGGEGSSHNKCDETYCGAKALSEPESTAVRNLIMDNKQRIKAYITLHSFGNYWLYPWGYNNQNSPNVKELKRVALIGQAALSKVYGTKYKVGSPGQIMYPAQGSDDWAHGEAHVPYVYCLELRPGGSARNGFLLPKSEIIPVGRETYAGIKAVAKAIVNTKCQANLCH